PASSVTTILANLVGRSVVSAITQTPASGPFGPLTTPPMSSASIATWPAAAPCWARTVVAGPVNHNPTAAIAIALIAAPVRRRLLSVMVSSRALVAPAPATGAGRPDANAFNNSLTPTPTARPRSSQHRWVVDRALR